MVASIEGRPIDGVFPAGWKVFTGKSRIFGLTLRDKIQDDIL